MLKVRIDFIGFDRKIAAKAYDFFNALLLFLEAVAAFRGSQSPFHRLRREARVGVVLTQKDAILGAGGEHAVRLVYALCDQIIDENAYISLVAVQDYGRVSSALAGRVDACHQSLSRCFLVARGAVYLSREVECFDFLRFQRVLELRGVEVIVLNGITGSIDD